MCAVYTVCVCVLCTREIYGLIRTICNGTLNVLYQDRVREFFVCSEETGRQGAFRFWWGFYFRWGSILRGGEVESSIGSVAHRLRARPMEESSTGLILGIVFGILANCRCWFCVYQRRPRRSGVVKQEQDCCGT